MILSRTLFMRFLPTRNGKSKNDQSKILFFEIFAPNVSKKILENLKILRLNNLYLKPVSAKVKKSKKSLRVKS